MAMQNRFLSRKRTINHKEGHQMAQVSHCDHIFAAGDQSSLSLPRGMDEAFLKHKNEHDTLECPS